MRTVFFVGNKRSGTSILIRSLNQHPDLHITHESDILWIMYSLYNHGEFQFYEGDSRRATLHTLDICKDILDQYKSLMPKELFTKCHDRIMKQGQPWTSKQNQYYSSKKPKIIGDKRPHQTIHTIDWVQKWFPDSVYIHIIRHPLDFVRSCKRLPEGDSFTSGKNDQEIIDMWHKHESAVETIRKTIPVLSTTHEEFLTDPNKVLSMMWEKIGVSPFEFKPDWEKRMLKDSQHKATVNAHLSDDVMRIIKDRGLCEE